ncbi:MAG: hypothetical protein JWL94_880 [Microbacteriaceae bacterium]|nr:hypothetical protein [Microbacteriaceae bacterium]HEV7956874.1 DUF3618 domain-containing protein [Marisediminicola sp.]
MARRKKKDQLTAAGVVSAVARGVAQQRSLAKARDINRGDRSTVPPEPKKPKKPKDPRSPEQIRAEVDATRARLLHTLGEIKYDVDVPSRARDLRGRVASQIPRRWRGEPRASIVAGSILATGLGGIVLAMLGRVRGSR